MAYVPNTFMGPHRSGIVWVPKESHSYAKDHAESLVERSAKAAARNDRLKEIRKFLKSVGIDVASKLQRSNTQQTSGSGGGGGGSHVNATTNNSSHDSVNGSFDLQDNNPTTTATHAHHPSPTHAPGLSAMISKIFEGEIYKSMKQELALADSQKQVALNRVTELEATIQSLEAQLKRMPAQMSLTLSHTSGNHILMETSVVVRRQCNVMKNSLTAMKARVQNVVVSVQSYCEEMMGHVNAAMSMWSQKISTVEEIARTTVRREETDLLSSQLQILARYVHANMGLFDDAHVLHKLIADLHDLPHDQREGHFKLHLGSINNMHRVLKLLPRINNELCQLLGGKDSMYMKEFAPRAEDLAVMQEVELQHVFSELRGDIRVDESNLEEVEERLTARIFRLESQLNEKNEFIQRLTKEKESLEKVMEEIMSASKREIGVQTFDWESQFALLTFKQNRSWNGMVEQEQTEWGNIEGQMTLSRQNIKNQYAQMKHIDLLMSQNKMSKKSNNSTVDAGAVVQAFQRLVQEEERSALLQAELDSMKFKLQAIQLENKTLNRRQSAMEPDEDFVDSDGEGGVVSGKTDAVAWKVRAKVVTAQLLEARSKLSKYENMTKHSVAVGTSGGDQSRERGVNTEPPDTVDIETNTTLEEVGAFDAIKYFEMWKQERDNIRKLREDIRRYKARISQLEGQVSSTEQLWKGEEFLRKEAEEELQQLIKNFAARDQANEEVDEIEFTDDENEEVIPPSSTAEQSQTKKSEEEPTSPRKKSLAVKRHTTMTMQDMKTKLRGVEVDLKTKNRVNQQLSLELIQTKRALDLLQSQLEETMTSQQADVQVKENTTLLREEIATYKKMYAEASQKEEHTRRRAAQMQRDRAVMEQTIANITPSWQLEETVIQLRNELGRTKEALQELQQANDRLSKVGDRDDDYMVPRNVQKAQAADKKKAKGKELSAEIEAVNAKLAEENKQLLVENDTLNHSIFTMQESFDNMKKTLTLQLIEEKNKRDEETATLRRDVEALRHQLLLKQKSKQLEELKPHESDAERLAQLTEEFEIMKRAFEMEKLQRDALKQKLEQERKKAEEFEKYARSIDDHEKLLQNTHSEESEHQKGELTKCRQNLVELEGVRNALETTLQDTKSALNHETQMHNDLKVEVEKYKGTIAEQAVALQHMKELQEQLAQEKSEKCELDNTLRTAQSTIADIKEDVKTLQYQVETLSENVHALEANVREKESQIQHLETELTASQNATAKLQHDIETLTENTTHHLKREAAFKDEISELTEQLYAQKTVHEELKDSHRLTQKEVEHLKVTHDHLEDSIQQIILYWEHRCDVAVDISGDMYTFFRETLTDMEVILQNKDAEVSNMKMLVTEAEESSMQAKMREVELTEQLEVLMSSKSKEKQDATEKYAKALRDVELKVREVEQLQAHLQATTESLQVMKKQRDDFEDQLFEREDSKAKARKQVEVLEIEVKQVRQNLAKAESEIQDRAKDIERLEQHLAKEKHQVSVQQEEYMRLVELNAKEAEKNKAQEQELNHTVNMLRKDVINLKSSKQQLEDILNGQTDKKKGEEQMLKIVELEAKLLENEAQVLEFKRLRNIERVDKSVQVVHRMRDEETQQNSDAAQPSVDEEESGNPEVPSAKQDKSKKLKTVQPTPIIYDDVTEIVSCEPTQHRDICTSPMVPPISSPSVDPPPLAIAVIKKRGNETPRDSNDPARSTEKQWWRG
eukprot:PhF_6_TR15941/c0_g1_i2/m.24768